jgi:hypothetical protein
MHELDVFTEHAYRGAFGNGAQQEIDCIRPELVVDLTCSRSIYNVLEVGRPEELRFSYEDIRLSNITGVQFINPWSLQQDDLAENTIPFFVTITSSDNSRACLLRYDVTQFGFGSYVNRPVLKQAVQTQGHQLEIVSPTIITDDYGTIWGTESGLLYVLDTIPRESTGERCPIFSRSAIPDPGQMRSSRDVASRIIVNETFAHTMRHRVGFDTISGRTFKVLRSTIVISDYVTHAQASGSFSLAGLEVKSQ